jgi:hypothetical protein
MKARGIFCVLAVVSALAAVGACVADDPSTGGVSTDTDAGGDGSTASNDANGGGDGAVMCTAPKVACNAACVDPASFKGDAKNCGACGHDCLGGACTQSVCSSATVLAASGTDASASSIASLAFDGSHLVFAVPNHARGSSVGQIFACDLPACSASHLVFDGTGLPIHEIDFLAASSHVPGAVYYSSYNGDGIYRVVTDASTSGGNPPASATPCASNAPNCEFLSASSMYSLAIDDEAGALYAANGGGGNAYHALLPNGSGLTEFGGTLFNLGASALALDPAESPRHWMYAVLAPNNTSGKIAAYDVTNTDEGSAVPAQLYTVNAGDATTELVGGIAVASGSVFWTQADGTVRSVTACAATCASNPTPTLLATTAGASQLISDGTNVVWSAGGSVYSCPATGCATLPPAAIATTPNLITALGQDSVSWFWGDELGGLYRIAK